MTKEVIVVSAVWCGACGLLKKQLDSNNIPYSVIDGDTPEGMAVCKEFGVRSLPTSLIYDNGSFVSMVVGNKYKEIVEEMQ